MLLPLALIVQTSFLYGVIATSIGSVLHEKRHAPTEYERVRVSPDSVLPIRIALRQNNLNHGYNHLMSKVLAPRVVHNLDTSYVPLYADVGIGVSHPDSPSYGKHWSTEQVHDFFAPADDSVKIVEEWLLSSGIRYTDIRRYENRGWLAIDMTATRAEKLFQTEFYEHDVFGDTRIGCDTYSLPNHVSPHVDFVKPGVVFSAPMRKHILKRSEYAASTISDVRPRDPEHNIRDTHQSRSSAAGRLPPELQECGANITPPCIRALYDIPKATYCQPENALGIFERGDKFSQADIDLFFKNFAPNVPQGTTPKVLSVDGGNAPVRAGSFYNGGEGTVDLDLAYSLIYPQTITLYQVDDDPQLDKTYKGARGLFNTFLDAIDGSYCNYEAYGISGDDPRIDPTYPDPRPKGYKGERMCGVYNLTRVLSISYALPEEEYPTSYIRRQCDEFMKLALQGHSIIAGSGDYGVAGTPVFGPRGFRLDCPNPSHRDRVHKPMMPSTCPYVTSVGGTRLYEGQTINDPESALEINATESIEGFVYPGFHTALEYVASGGGFSNYFLRPSYQEPAVSRYLANEVTLPSYVANYQATNIGDGGVYNRVGRGFPDVSANGANLLYYIHKERQSVYGTSLSTPIFASMITLINEERTAAGKGPVGFVNPVLYRHPEIFNDIKNGSNYNCASPGFKATEGWDAVTGLGTPNYPKMLDLFMSLP